MLSGDFFLLHPLCWQLLKELHAGLLRGSGGDLGVFVRLRGLPSESHHRDSDGSWWSVIIRDLLLPGSTSYCWWVIPAFLRSFIFTLGTQPGKVSCRRRSDSRGTEGLHSRSSRASLWIP